MSTIESQIQKLNDTNAELARVNNELTNTVRTHTSKINNEVEAAKNTMSAATASAISEVKADANAVNAEIKARMDDAVVPWLPAMTKVQFDALRADRKQKYAGSGFVEWGKHRNGWENINEGMSIEVTGSNRINLGSGLHANTNAIGQSSLKAPRVVMDGVNIELDSVGVNASISYQANLVLLPPAPDGTKTYDSATGTVTQHTNAEVAFTSETATNKVITSRKDLVFLESWHERISDKDIVYPLGNVQYGVSSYEGIALSNNLVAQGYSAFGEWDENTKGYGVRWSSLTDVQKAMFLSELENNIYYDPQAKGYIQVRYRIRVVEGKSNDWDERTINGASASGAIFGLNYGLNVNRIAVRGQSVSRIDWAVDGNNFFHNQTWIHSTTNLEVGYDRTLWRQRSAGAGVAFNNSARAVPIALIQRMNQGAYHPSYNPMGCASLEERGYGFLKWYRNERLPEGFVASTSDCFNKDDGMFNTIVGITGSISGGTGRSGRSDQYEYYDAIYAGQVEDLRLNANKLDVNKLREDTMRKAVAGTLRGAGKVPFTKMGKGNCFDSAITIYIYKAAHLSEENTLIDGTFFGANSYLSSLKNGQKFKGAPVAIKFLSAGNTNLTTYAGGTALNQWLFIDDFSIESNNQLIALTNPKTQNVNWFSEGRGATIEAELLYPTEQQGAEFDSLPWVDIIGHPERIATTFPNGVVGQWVPKLPDNSSGYPLNRKMTNAVLNASYSRDLGATWTNTNVGHNALLNTSSGSWNPEVVTLLTYESQANFTELATSSNIVDSCVGDIFVSLSASTNQGNRLHPSLTNKIGKSGVSDPTFKSYSVASSQVMNDKLLYEPKHQLMDVAKPANNSPAVKALPTITEKNGLYYLQLHGAELKHHTPTFTDVNPSSNTTYTEGNFYRLTNYGAKGYYVCEVTKTFVLYTNTDYIQMENGDITHGPTNQVVLRKLNTADGGSWGDDQTIPIVNGEDVKTDLNGNTVKVFCHHTQIPLGIAHND
ncbi:hypothetical protein J8L98_22580 [Pseudoalteromonas sp. MMG013]|uniref:hypothetical protein n=1 Tax=Pseudoalteromonas sp. MMG013 TaxID=2822687 RepID=UPI001B385E96|nr:hypothetical protein [Pseudoalteromonas sp. MMG013]MBQ4864482.1 hypothetical protein [Pseudoalteromonas sp. MMG013]